MGGTTPTLKNIVKCVRYFWMQYPKNLCEKYNADCIILSLYVSNWILKPSRDIYCEKLIDVCEKYKKGECEWSAVVSIFIQVAHVTKSKLVKQKYRNDTRTKCTMINYFQ